MPNVLYVPLCLRQWSNLKHMMWRSMLKISPARLTCFSTSRLQERVSTVI